MTRAAGAKQAGVERAVGRGCVGVGRERVGCRMGLAGPSAGEGREEGSGWARRKEGGPLGWVGMLGWFESGWVFSFPSLFYSISFLFSIPKSNKV